jgi:3-hydroxyacyl-CoA dehydrogenase
VTRRVAIIGLGQRGLAFARAFHRAGWIVAGFDPDPRADLCPAPKRDWRRETTISASVARAEWVVLCLPERLELLRAVCQRVQTQAPDQSILAAVTREIDAVSAQDCALRPARIIRIGPGSSGGHVLETSANTPDDLRADAVSVLAMLGATGDLALDRGGDADQSPAAESA